MAAQRLGSILTNIDLECYLTTIAVYDGFNYSSHTGWARIIYAK
jgi:hypothetical protein